jgi:hypothetical protein
MREKIKCHVDFECLAPNCNTPVAFNLMDATEKDKQIICPSCHHAYEFEDDLKDKLTRLLKLILAVREAENILGDCNVSVNVPSGTVKIPYPLLLTRLNTLISLDMQGRKVDFHFRMEPSSADTFK